MDPATVEIPVFTRWSEWAHTSGDGIEALVAAAVDGVKSSDERVRRWALGPGRILAVIDSLDEAEVRTILLRMLSIFEPVYAFGLVRPLLHLGLGADPAVCGQAREVLLQLLPNLESRAFHNSLPMLLKLVVEPGERHEVRTVLLQVLPTVESVDLPDLLRTLVDLSAPDPGRWEVLAAALGREGLSYDSADQTAGSLRASIPFGEWLSFCEMHSPVDL